MAGIEAQYPELIFIAVVGLLLIASPFAQRVVGRLALRFAIKTESVVDDLVVDALRPFRFVYAFPAGAAFFLSELMGAYAYETRLLSGLLLIALGVEFTIKLLGAVSAVIRHKAGAKGVSSTGYIDLFKIFTVLVGLALAASVTLETDLFSIVAGLGAATAVAGFIFQDTLRAIFASIRIASWNLIREGDWIYVPSFNADGPVEHIGLYDIKVRNWDLTTSLIPTNKLLEVANINFASMQVEARARRIQETFYFNTNSVKQCDRALLERLKEIPLIAEDVAEKLEALGERDTPENLPDLVAKVGTNFELYSKYVDQYLRSRKDLNVKQRFVLVRTLAPTKYGIPLDIFAFVRKTDLIGFSNVQTEIFNHLISLVAVFDLQLFQAREE